VKRELAGGYELDDDPDRIDIDAVHAFISGESYWGHGRPRATVERAVRKSDRVVGLYKDDVQVGFSRAVTDEGAGVAYLADVYVLAAHRGHGLGLELVREMVDNGPLAGNTWLLHTRDMHRLYAKVGFGPPDERLMERPA
jgi:GNAT superfamily N-acetyltransferase